jgi:hypothetical protein
VYFVIVSSRERHSGSGIKQPGAGPKSTTGEAPLEFRFGVRWRIPRRISNSGWFGGTFTYWKFVCISAIPAREDLHRGGSNWSK